MTEIKRWFGWLLIIGPIHMSEQLMTGIDELQELKGFAAKYYSLFRDPDYGTVVLTMIIFSLVNVIVYAMLMGGRARLIALALFAMVGLGEVHHIAKTIVHLAYFPGTVTSIPFVLFGALLFRALVREWGAITPARKLAAAA